MSLFLCYLFRACHLHFCDAHMGFLVGAVGMGCCLCLHRLKVALMSPWMEDSSIGSYVDGIIGVWRKENLVPWWGTLRLLFLWALSSVAWAIMESWTITWSNTCLSFQSMMWGGGGYPLLSSLTFNSSISTWITQHWIFPINSCCHVTPWSHPTNCMVKWIIHT